jgi:hypothetical protein
MGEISSTLPIEKLPSIPANYGAPLHRPRSPLQHPRHRNHKRWICGKSVINDRYMAWELEPMTNHNLLSFMKLSGVEHSIVLIKKESMQHIFSTITAPSLSGTHLSSSTIE